MQWLKTFLSKGRRWERKIDSVTRKIREEARMHAAWDRVINIQLFTLGFADLRCETQRKDTDAALYLGRVSERLRGEHVCLIAPRNADNDDTTRLHALAAALGLGPIAFGEEPLLLVPVRSLKHSLGVAEKCAAAAKRARNNYAAFGRQLQAA